MTTLNDIDFLAKVHEQAMDNYNRTCRRVTALVMGGRTIDRKTRDYVDCRRACAELTKLDLDNAIEVQAMAASV